MRPATDQVLAERYRLVSRIAGGGMGEVWLAADQVLDREVAVKILRRELADDATFRARFRAEARNTAGLSHPGIAAVYDYRDGAEELASGAPTSPFLVMERVHGEPLSRIIARDGALPPRRTLQIVGRAALALQAAHEAGVVHRDVKPGNILVAPDGAVKLTDFGIARAAGAVPLTKTGAIMGTAHYISPEQASGRPVTPASDVYSLGVVAYECLTGRKPFDGDTPVSVALAQVSDPPPALGPDVAPEVRDLVMAMLAKDPAKRPASAGDAGRAALALVPSAADTTIALPVSSASRDDGPPTGELPAVEAPAHEDAVRRTALRDRSSDTNPGFQLPAPGRTPAWAPYVVGLAAVAVLTLLLVRACSGSVSSDNPPAPSPASRGAAAVLVRAGDLIGEPVATVRRQLQRSGLHVALQPVAAAHGAEVGTVTGVEPAGRLSPDETVTLTYLRAGPAGPGKDGPGKGGPGKHGKHHGKGHGKHKGEDSQ